MEFRDALPRRGMALGLTPGLRRATLLPVDSETLRAVQQPLKDRYSADPDAALVTLTADGALGEGITCSVATGRALVEAGLHPATGGDGLSACSGDMLLQALVACSGVTMRAVATALGLTVGGTVHAEGDLDFRGTLAVDRGAPVGFRAIRLSFDLVTDATDDQIATLLRLTERYCVVYQTLAVPPALTVDRA
ncbi:MAG: OsmC family protein [Actinobacteria bacterium]|nr:OsmC family protein [Actinomycetota bacterium]